MDTPVYRGSKIDMSDMKEGEIKSWPSFTSTSTRESVALDFTSSTKPGKHESRVLMKIFLNG